MKLPQLSLRELFLLVALVAMGCGWWVRERSILSREAEVKRRERNLAKEEELFEAESMRSEAQLISASNEVDNRRRALGLPTLPPPR